MNLSIADRIEAQFGRNFKFNYNEENQSLDEVCSAACVALDDDTYGTIIYTFDDDSIICVGPGGAWQLDQEDLRTTQYRRCF